MSTFFLNINVLGCSRCKGWPLVAVCGDCRLEPFSWDSGLKPWLQAWNWVLRQCSGGWANGSNAECFCKSTELKELILGSFCVSEFAALFQLRFNNSRNECKFIASLVSYPSSDPHLCFVKPGNSNSAGCAFMFNFSSQNSKWKCKMWVFGINSFLVTKKFKHLPPSQIRRPLRTMPRTLFLHWGDFQQSLDEERG